MGDIEREILEMLQEELGVELQLGDDLTRLGIDSLRMTQLAARLERRFDFRNDQDVFEVETVNDLVQYVRDRT